MSGALGTLTGAYGNGLLGQDPAYMPAEQRLALARSLIGEGLSSAPAYPLQGLSRVAQALLGNYELNKGNAAIQDTMRQRQQAAMGAYSGAMAPFGGLAGALTGPPPQSAAPVAPLPTTPSQTAPTPSATPLAAPIQARSASLPAVVQQLESGGSNAPGIVGDGGAAAGPMQVHQAALDDVNRAHGTNYTLDQLTANPALGKQVGDLYLALQQQRFPNRPDLALAAYNAGPTATANAGGPGVPGVPPSAAPYVAKGEAMLGNAAPSQAQAAPPQTGLSNPNILRAFQLHQAALRMMLADPYNAQTHQLAQGLEQTSQMLMGMDTFVPGPNGTQVNARTGEVKYAPVGRVTTDSAGNVISVDAGGAAHIVSPADVPGASALAGGKAGAEAAAKDQWHPAVQNGVPGQMNAVTGEFKPTVTGTPRIAQTPAGDLVVAEPGTGNVRVAIPANNPGVGARAAAQSQGTATGTQAAVTVPKMAEIGRDADTAIGNIDYGMNQLHQAAAGGINSGYFAPWLATAAAAGKSLGVDIKSLGVDPQAVGNVQSAQKTLGVVAGTILQNTIGKDSGITDAKIEHFIHTQPGIETDPQALERVLGWARSQFVYNRGMAMDAMSNVDPQTGMLAPGWQASYYKKAGAFAPIYDPLSQEMKQPTGEGPAPGMPTAAQAATPPVAGARQAPDGNWYVPDSARTGKYLRVQP